MRLAFTITFDYLCPFARNANEHVIAALQAGADWDVTFLPYSLAQGHVEEGQPAIWDREDPDGESGVLAFEAGLAVRDHLPEDFLAVHRELFAARHDRGEDIKDRDVIATALANAGVDAEHVFDLITTKDLLGTLRDEHTRAVEEHGVWGVPTFIAGDRAVFVRLMDRPEGDAERARDRIERVLTLVTDFPELHEFKQVDLPY